MSLPATTTDGRPAMVSAEPERQLAMDAPHEVLVTALQAEGFTLVPADGRADIRDRGCRVIIHAIPTDVQEAGYADILREVIADLKAVAERGARASAVLARLRSATTDEDAIFAASTTGSSAITTASAGTDMIEAEEEATPC